MTWRADAKCRGMDTSIFFYGPLGSRRLAARARAICQACPVRIDCLEEALASEETGLRFGFLGGMTPDERDAEARRRYRTPGRPARAECGTNAGYYRHHRRHEPTCQPCRDAHAAAEAARLAARTGVRPRLVSGGRSEPGTAGTARALANPWMRGVDVVDATPAPSSMHDRGTG